MTARNDVFGTGIVVPDLEPAIKDAEAVLGLSFTPVQESPLVLGRPGGRREEVSLRFVYSLGTAPYVELIEAIPGTYYDASGGGYIRHIAMWVDDLSAAADELQGRGMTLEAWGVDGDREPALFVFLTSPHGFRLEIVDRANRANFEGWLAGGDLGL